MRFQAAVIASVLAFPALAQDAGLAAGWYVSGKGAANYRVSSVEAGRCGKRGARVESSTATPGPLALLQTFRAHDYRGERMRYSATVDAQDLDGWGGLFFRADAAEKKTVSFDDMRTRPLRGTLKCARVSVVVDVPKEAELVTLGLVVEGSGSVELSDVSFDRTDPDMPKTAGVEQAHGRVGNWWFNEDTISTNSIGAMTFLVKRESPGVWRDGERGDVEATVEGDQIAVRLLKRLGGQPQVLTGRLTITHVDGVTTISGEYGGALMRYPLLVTWDANRIDTKWGGYERHLKVEPAPQLAKGCRFYAERASPSQFADVLELCGGVLSPTPPPVPTIVAFLMNGFRRLGNGLGAVGPAVAPFLPDPNPGVNKRSNPGLKLPK
ncbi:MAG: hypothetical protein QM817_17435 [Archangium sp.]